MKENFYWENMQCGSNIDGHSGVTCKTSRPSKTGGSYFILTIQGFKNYVFVDSGSKYVENIRNLGDVFPKLTSEVDGEHDFSVRDNATSGNTQEIFFIKTYHGNDFITLKGVRIK
jgi:hypothetical protein